MGASTAALSVVRFPVTQPPRGPVDWRILGNLLQQIAGKGDRDFLDMMAKRAYKHLELLESAERLTRE